MSLLYKRDDSPMWYVTQTRQSTGTTNRKDAEEFARKTLSQAWRDEKLGDKRYTFNELANSWLDEKAEKRSLKDDERVIRDFKTFLHKRDMLDKPLQVIDAGTLRQYATQIKLRASASTANGHMRVLRAMLNHGVAEEMLDRRPPVKMFEVIQEARDALTVAQIAAIGEHLPEWVRDMFVFAGQTGLRYGNIAGLRFEWLTDGDTLAVVPAIVAKTKRSYTVPLSAIARDIVARRRSECAKGAHPRQSDSGYVFWNPEKPWQRVENHIMRNRWEKATAAVGLPHVNWHLATRHTWASHHTMNGTPDRVLQEMAGWSSPAMLQRYVHLKTEHLVRYADNVNAQK
jgi:integrase